MNKRRLLKLADLLEADAKNKKGVQFDIRKVAERRGGFYDIAPLDCGTTACAIGLWGLSGKFADDGVTYSKGDGWPIYKDRVGLPAAQMYFGISQTEGEWLFLAAHYRRTQHTGAAGERAVAKRIRDFVAGKVSP